MNTLNNDILTKHYLIAMIWTNDDEFKGARLTKQAKEAARAYCSEFAETINKEGLYAQILECPDYWAHPDCGGRVEAAIGHDLWLTSQGHGSGFWDRAALPDELGGSLSACCGYGKPFEPQEPYTSKGWIYL